MIFSLKRSFKKSFSIDLLHCDFTIFITSKRRDPTVAAFPLDDVGEQASRFPPLLAGEARRGRHAERQRSISPFV